TGVGVESTVVDCTQSIPIILRPGGITKERVEQVAGSVMVDPALADVHHVPKAPGMKYPHYAPDVPLWLLEGSAQNIQEFIDSPRFQKKRIGVLASTETASQLKAERIIPLGQEIRDIAANLYDGLRTFKE